MAFDVRRSFDEVRREDHLADQGLRVAELALWSASADGVVEGHELAGIVKTIRQVPGLSDFDTADAQELLVEMALLGSDEQVSARLERLADGIHDDGLRRAAFQLAVYCASSDGHFSESEIALLRWLAGRFDIPPARATEFIREVIS